MFGCCWGCSSRSSWGVGVGGSGGGPDGKKNISRVGEIFVGADDGAVESMVAGLLAETKIAWFAHFVDEIRGV